MYFRFGEYFYSPLTQLEDSRMPSKGVTLRLHSKFGEGVKSIVGVNYLPRNQTHSLFTHKIDIRRSMLLKNQ